MNCGTPNKKEKTINECIKGLETLFNYYKNDSEFNHQLTICDSEFNTLKKLVGYKEEGEN